MAHRLIIVVLSILHVGATLAQDISTNELLQNYHYDQVDQILNDIFPLNKIPDATNFMSYENDTVVVLISPQSLPKLKKATEVFYEAQSIFFTNKPITLKYCTKESNCGFSAEYQLKEIHFQTDLVENILINKRYTNPLDVLRYISSHEVAHYVHEISTHMPYSYEQGLSFHGNISSYQDHFTVFINSLNESDRKSFFDPNSKISKDFSRAYSIKGFRTHAEVDMIATVKLMQSGFTNWSDVIKFLDSSIAEEKSINSEFSKSVILDFENRKRVILKTLKEYKI